MNLKLLLCSLGLCLPFISSAQIWNGQDTLYGVEWVAPGTNALRLAVTEDGLYRITAQQLQQAGMPAGTSGEDLRLYCLGREEPLWLSEEGPLSGNDFVVFYGKKGRSELDRLLFEAPEAEMLNPGYGLFTDTLVYFLRWDEQGSPPRRYTTQPNNLSDPPAALPGATFAERRNFHQQHVQKRYDADNLVALSHFDVCEGFASAYQIQHELSLELPGLYAADPQAELHLRLASWFGDEQQLQVSANGEWLHQQSYGPYELIDLQLPLPPEAVQPQVDLLLQGLNGNLDRYALSVVELRYRRTFDFAGETRAEFTLPPAAQERLLEITGFGQGGGELQLFNLSQDWRISIEEVDGKWPCVIPPSATKDTFLLVDAPSAALAPADIRSVSFTDKLLYSEADFLILTHPALRTGSPDPVQEYADYRRSQAGGGHEVQVVEVPELYLHFGYGIPDHPQALRNFWAYVQREWPNAEYVLLLGHGFTYPQVREPGSTNRATHFVPTFGDPGSDNLLMPQPGSSAPRFALGRVAARHPLEVSAYLEKLKAYEAGFSAGQTIEQQAWRRRVLHLVGGNPTEQQSFRFLLNLMAQDLQNSGFGAQVQTVEKTSSDPVQSSPSQAVIDAVNEGVVIKNFLGHGAVANTGFGLDDPDFFQEDGRYPLILSLGCLSGNVFDPQNSVSERFVLAPGQGSIGYLASSGFGYPGTLTNFGRDFYRLLGEELYGQGLGMVVKKVKEKYGTSPSFPVRSLAQQLHLHADPALRISGPPVPDYTPDFRSVRIQPANLSAELDSFVLSLDIVNLGRGGADTLVLAFERRAEDGALLQWRDTVVVDAPFFSYTTTLPVLGAGFSGENLLFLRLDPDDRIAELPAPSAEENNELRLADGAPGFSFYILNNAAHPADPPPFAIVGEDSQQLTASLNNPLAEAQPYVIELDTTAYFNSPLLQREHLLPEGGLLRWSPEPPLLDSTVYYWRVSPDSLETGRYSWAQSSFLYLSGEGPGWNQSHFFQWRKNHFDNTTLTEPQRRLAFVTTTHTVIAEAMVTSPSNDDRSRYFINNDRYMKVTPAWNRNLTVVVIDPQTGLPWQRPGVNTFGYTFPVFDADDRKVVMDFLADSIPAGHYALFMTWHREGFSYDPELWAADSLQYDVNLFQLLEAQGAQQVRQLASTGSRPYVFAWVQGEGPLAEALAPAGEERISVLFDMEVAWEEGDMTSVLIGPARSWQELRWALEGAEAGQEDWAVEVWGKPSPEAPAELLLSWGEAAGAAGLSGIDPEVYPRLQLRLAVADSLQRTSPHPLFWRLRYQGTGDAALAPELGFQFRSDTLQQGEPLQLQLAVRNLLAADMDSLLMRFTIVDEDNNRLVEERRLAPLLGRDSLLALFAADTRHLQGRHQLIIEANPSSDQPERNLQNNRAILPFFVQRDRANPLLQVTFDGKSIPDGGLVSARPVVDIRLWDENPWLSISDTATFQAEWRYEGEDWQPLLPSDPETAFFPAPAPAEEARLQWRPHLQRDGRYELRVNGRDASGNPAGSLSYRISFRVERQPALSHLVAFPNPTRGHCRFAYVLTGEAPPEAFRLEIYDLDGRLLREIGREEFGPLRVGSHLSDFIWDGTDAQGRPLPSGVYLYRVIARSGEGQPALRHYPTEADGYFGKGYGRVVIMR